MLLKLVGLVVLALVRVDSLSICGIYDINNNHYFEVCINDDTGTTNFTVVGPEDVYHSIGFGGRSMDGTYAITYGDQGDGMEVFERELGDHDEGNELQYCGGDTCVTLIDVTDDGGLRTLIMERDSASQGADDYEFTTDVEEIDIIYGFGDSEDWERHDTRGSGRLLFVEPTTTEDGGNANVDEKFFEVSELEDVDIRLGVYMNRSHIILEIYGPTDRFFAIGWGSHDGGDAVIWTGNSTSDNLDWHLNGRDDNDVDLDNQQDWWLLETTEIGGERYVEVIRLLDTGDNNDMVIDFEDDSMDIRYSQGPSGGALDPEYHGSANRGQATLDFESGKLKTKKEDEIWTSIEHAALMFLGWTVLMPLAIIIHRYGRNDLLPGWTKYKYLSFQTHRVLMVTAYCMILMAFFIKLLLHSEIRNSAHAILGFLWILILSVFVPGAFWLNAQEDLMPEVQLMDNSAIEGDSQALNRVASEKSLAKQAGSDFTRKAHKFGGMILLGFSVIIMCLGFAFEEWWGWMGGYIVWLLIVIAVFGFLEFQLQNKKNT